MNTDKIYAEQLANEYAPKNDSKVIALRKLDARAKLPATIFTYTFGIISALITGIGMCLSMPPLAGQSVQRWGSLYRFSHEATIAFLKSSNSLKIDLSIPSKSS